MSNQFKGHYKRDKVKTDVPPEFQSFNYTTRITLAPKNKGLYSGNIENNKYFPPNIPATAVSYLKQFNKTPGANMHYVGNNRYMNNFTPMPNIYEYNPSDGNKYNIIGPL